MAAQSVVAIEIVDRANPVELQTWLTNHPLAVITSVVIRDSMIYIIFA